LREFDKILPHFAESWKQQAIDAHAVAQVKTIRPKRYNLVVCKHREVSAATPLLRRIETQYSASTSA
jgi:hypothetical protein